MALGDRLAVERRIAGSTVSYSHHGIDVGDGTVVHARPDDFRAPFGGGRVERTSRAAFAAGRGVRIVTEPPAVHPPEEIVARAVARVGRDGYCPVIDNCEHFATWCATGRRSSRQVDLVVARAVAVVGRVAAVVSAGAGSRVAARALAGTGVRLGLRTLVPLAVIGEAAALAVEWRAHQRGGSAWESRRAGDAAGFVAPAVAGLPAGPAGVLAGAVSGATLWCAGSAAAAVSAAVQRRSDR